eukprot:m.55815 g.55815  ORF g.55815 m.55815 type:complete len:439 (+) comp11149_c0_seq2:66-1382(+)
MRIISAASYISSTRFVGCLFLISPFTCSSTAPFSFINNKTKRRRRGRSCCKIINMEMTDADDFVCTPRMFLLDTCRYRSNLPPLESGDVLPYNEGPDDMGLYGDAEEEGEGQEDRIVNDEETGVFRCDVTSIPEACYGGIIGRGGSTKKGLESDTNTRIYIKQKNNSNSNRRGRGQGRGGLYREPEGILVEGKSYNDVEVCRTRLQLLAEETIRTRLPPTHFISVPLNTPQLKERVTQFANALKTEYTGDTAIPGLFDDMFVDVASFHVTVGVMKLYYKNDVDLAVRTLEECAKELTRMLEGGTREVVVRGLSSFPPGKQAKSNQLWAKVASSSSSTSSACTFQDLMNTIASEFHSKGLMDNETVEVHATIVNNKHHKDRGQQRGQRGRRIPIDLREVLANSDFCDYEFGTTSISSLHLSKMKRQKGEFYDAEHTVTI